MDAEPDLPPTNLRALWKRLATATVLFFALLLLVAILLPSRHSRYELSYRTMCQNNLKMIGLSMLMYANDNHGQFPRTPFEDTGRDPIIPFVTNQGRADPNPFEGSGPNDVPPNSVPASIFWILRSQEGDSLGFCCLASDADGDKFGADFVPTNTALNRGNFTNIQKNLSYSMTNPFAARTGDAKLFKWNTTLKADFPLFADLNPGGTQNRTATGVKSGFTTPSVHVDSTSNPEQLKWANSPNHNREGQNVLYADGHVEWHVNPLAGRPIKGGKGIQDNIYARSGTYATSTAEIDGPNLLTSPANPDDAVMLPTAP